MSCKTGAELKIRAKWELGEILQDMAKVKAGRPTDETGDTKPPVKLA